MHGWQLPFGATASLIGGPAMFLHGFRTLRLKRLIQNTPTARIRSMAMGLVEVSGKVAPRSTVTAPFSGHACAYWEIDIAVRGRNSWSTVHRNASGHPFFVRDDTGVAMVYPHGATCKIPFGVEEQFAGISLPECYSQYLSQQNLPMSTLWRLSTMRFRERVIEEGQHVYVLGSAMPRANSFSISDGEALQATGTDSGAVGVPNLMDEVKAVIRQGENERAFIISEESERALTMDLGWEATARLLGGPALALFGLGYWLYAGTSGHLFR